MSHDDQNATTPGNFRQAPLRADEWNPDGSVITRISFIDSESLDVKDVLTNLSKKDFYSPSHLEKVVNRELPEFLEDRLGKYRAKLTGPGGFSVDDISVQGASLQSTGFDLHIGFEIDANNARKGKLGFELQIGAGLFETPDRIPAILRAVEMAPTTVRMSLRHKTEPSRLEVRLKAAGWTITNSLPHKIEAEHPSKITITVQADSIMFGGFSPLELWGDARNRDTGSILSAAMNLMRS